MQDAIITVFKLNDLFLIKVVDTKFILDGILLFKQIKFYGPNTILVCKLQRLLFVPVLKLF